VDDASASTMRGVDGRLQRVRVETSPVPDRAECPHVDQWEDGRRSSRRTGPEKKLLKKTASALKKVGKLVKSKGTKKVLSPEQIADFGARASAIQTDVSTLASSL
jgi:hypothetical protein